MKDATLPDHPGFTITKSIGSTPQGHHRLVDSEVRCPDEEEVGAVNGVACSSAFSAGIPASVPATPPRISPRKPARRF
jgi:hypothetical protein